MDNREIINTIRYIINENQQGASLTPQMATSFLKTANILLLKRKIGLPENYNPMNPFPREIFQATLVNTIDLQPFMMHMGNMTSLPLAVNSDGLATLPPDFFYPTGILFIKPTESGAVPRMVTLVTDIEWMQSLGNTVTTPTEEYPMAKIFSGGMYVRPADVKFVDFSYIRKPADPVYDYYIDNATAREVYLSPGETPPLTGVTYSGIGGTGNISASVELEWNDINKVNIMAIMLSFLGVNLKANDIIGYAEKLKSQGQ